VNEASSKSSLTVSASEKPRTGLAFDFSVNPLTLKTVLLRMLQKLFCRNIDKTFRHDLMSLDYCFIEVFSLSVKLVPAFAFNSLPSSCKLPVSLTNTIFALYPVPLL
jgi:hypothetical protein